MKEKEENNGRMKLESFIGVSMFKSIRRAMRRGHVTEDGMVAPNRPFNNRGNTSNIKGIHSREQNEYKKRIYGQLVARYSTKRV